MTRRLVVTYLVVTALVLLVLQIPLALTYADREEARFLTAVERDARTLSASVEGAFVGGGGPEPAGLVQAYARRVGGRAVVVGADGRSVADSDPQSPPGRTFADRAEVAEALDGAVTSGRRRSDTLATDLLFAAVPVVAGGEVVAAVRITYPSSELDRRVRDNLVRLAGLAGLVLAAVAAVGWLLARQVTRPVARLRAATARLAAGDLTARARSPHGPPELRALAADFDEMASRMQRLVTSQRSFAADASHQLRTPLTALRLRLEAAADGDPGALEAALDETDRLQATVHGLLLLARTEATAPMTVVIDAAAVARERVETWSALAEERGVALACEASGPSPVRAIDTGLEQILDNLLANALDACPPGCTVRVVVEPGAVVVDDDGPGMTDEQLARATDRFWRAPGAKPGGTGLGLAIVEQLASRSGGSVRLGHRPGGGLRARVELPVASSAR